MNETPNRNLALDLVRVTEAAALAASHWMGRGQKEAGDGAAVEAMRLILCTVEMDGVVVIGEGAKDEAPMLFDGEKIGNGRGPAVDVAVDPIEGTALLAYGRPDAISVVGIAPRGTMWSPGPAYYMNKLVVGREARSALHAGLLAAPVSETLSAIAAALAKPLGDLTIFVLDKPRHQKLIADIREAGARVLLRTDGDVAGALMAAMPNSGVDVLMGIGGTPEGVIAACAVRALGGAMLGQLAPQKEDERKAIESAGLDLDEVLTENELVRSDDVFFAATGITDGVLMPGVHYSGEGASTVSIVMRGKTGTIRKIYAEHRLDKLRSISAVAY
ncbi:MAG: class II fructose-bisphosphatase [Chloroflexi bacterium]|nr:class II fructose-bisphosphatase [Chloroflexota bacterium]MBI5964524.1 class II fructose-bisphosphatase [Chloroflexota bacterium]